MKSVYTIAFLALSFFATAQTRSGHKTAPLTEAAPERVGMSAERLARIDSLCLKAVAVGQVPGMVALVARNGKIVYHKAFGLADAASNKPMQRDAIFRIASQTKAITATAVMMLWEQGKFRLDDPISKYIPAFKAPQVLKSFQYRDTSYTTEPAKTEITIRHLLTHTSGLGYGIIDGDERFKMIYQKAGVTDLFTTASVAIGESVKKLAALPLHFNPGEKYSYSEGLDVLGYLVEVVSGQPFNQFLRQHLFDPLGMNDTWFYLPQQKAARLVTVQKKEGAKWAPYPATFYDPQYPVTGAKTFFSGGGGLSSTAKDYATFLQMYLNGGELNGVRILSRTTVETILTNQTGNLMGDEGFYGLAFGGLTPKGAARGGQGTAQSFSWGGYFNTQSFADGTEKIIGILMKQTQGNTGDETGAPFRVLVSAAIDD